jgi:type I restriction enzyme M protein
MRLKPKGYFIYPSQLFAKWRKTANTNPESLNTDLAAIFSAIESSANGYPSEPDIKGLFADFDTTSNRLGNTVKDKNTRLAAVLKGVAGLDFGRFFEKTTTSTCLAMLTSFLSLTMPPTRVNPAANFLPRSIGV